MFCLVLIVLRKVYVRAHPGSIHLLLIHFCMEASLLVPAFNPFFEYFKGSVSTAIFKMYIVWRKRSIFTVKCLPFSGSPAPPLPSVMSPSRVAASRLTQQGSDLIVPAGIHCTDRIKPFLLLLKLNSLTQFPIACFIFLGVLFWLFWWLFFCWFFFFNNKESDLSSHSLPFWLFKVY